MVNAISLRGFTERLPCFGSMCMSAVALYFSGLLNYLFMIQ